VNAKVNLLLLLIAAAALAPLGRIVGMMVRLLVGLISGFVLLAAAVVVLVFVASHGKLL
jgi:hypothetical protein